MNDKQVENFVAALAAEIKQAELLANDYAISYVKTGNEKQCEASKRHLDRMDTLNKAKSLFLLHLKQEK